MKRQLAFIACLAALLAWLPALAQELKFATQNPKGHPVVTGMERFAEIVTARSGGKIKINLFPGGVLGGDQANVSALPSVSQIFLLKINDCGLYWWLLSTMCFCTS